MPARPPFFRSIFERTRPLLQPGFFVHNTLDELLENGSKKGGTSGTPLVITYITHAFSFPPNSSFGKVYITHAKTSFLQVPLVLFFLDNLHFDQLVHYFNLGFCT
jgi:hypothetical protein